MSQKGKEIAMRETRLEEMQEYIYANKTVAIESLCETFQVSRNTVHRDLDQLVKRGVIRKIYGGVVAEQTSDTVPFEDRAIKNIEAKRRIAQRAVELLEPDDVIYVDTGSTASCFFHLLPKNYNLTIFTNNIELLCYCAQEEGFSVIFTGGKLSRKTCSVVGEDAVELLSRYNISKAFLSAAGVSPEHGFSNSTYGEYQVKRAAIAASRQVYMMLDSSKFGAVSMKTFCGFEDVDVLITDCHPADSYMKKVDENSIRLIVAENKRKNTDK